MNTEEKRKICFILLPGFSPDHKSVDKLQETLENRGYSTVATNFFGDIVVDDFRKLTIDECKKNISDLINATAPKYDKLYGVGVSMGGAMLMEHAKNNDNLAGILVIGAPFRIKHRWIPKLLIFFMPIVYFVRRPFEKIKKWRMLPSGSGKMVFEYLNNDFLKDLEKIKTPIVFVHSRKDMVADYKALEEFSKKISSTRKKIIIFENGDHVADHDPNSILECLEDFFQLK